MYLICLYQTTSEIQTVHTSDSLEEIRQLWEQVCSADDEYSEFDERLALYLDGELLESYLIPDSQKDQ